MTEPQFTELCAWITEAGLAGRSEADALEGFCARVIDLGVPLARVNIVIDTLHPVYEGRAFVWKCKTRKTSLSEFGRSSEASRRWENSPFYYLETNDARMLRRRLTPESEKEFPVFPELRAEGLTDYVAVINRFAAEGVIGAMDCVYSSWSTDNPAGFTDSDVDDLMRLTPLLSLTLKAASLARIASTLVETYLGHDAGRRVLGGRIRRGVAEQIEAAIWFSDLRGYTRLSDAAPPAEIIPLLNEYADAAISAIHEHGGDVLKLIGDGILAIFTGADRTASCEAALAAAQDAPRRIAKANERRISGALPTTELYLGLHFGEMFYGNIGSKERLDFTIVGPAVNEVSRIASMSRTVDQPLLLSSAFADALGPSKNRLVSVGRYALRGVSKPQTLYTLDSDGESR